jgi:rubrerythrin
MFSIHEIFDIAIRMEKNGEDFYRTASEKISEPSVCRTLVWLADQEVMHYEWLTRRKESLVSHSDKKKWEEIGKSMLEEAVKNQVFSLDDLDLSQISHTDTIIKAAIEFENDTVIFLQMLQSFITDQEIIGELEAIIDQEHRHIAILNDL